MWLYYRSYIEGSVGTSLFFNFDGASYSLLQGRVHAGTGYEVPQGTWRYSSTLSFSLALGRGGWSTPHPATHFTGGWVGPRASCGKIPHTGI